MSEGHSISQKYWFSTIKPGTSALAHCNMETEDIDECTSSVRLCDVNATCTNNNGSYLCTCKIGFSGDGKTCNGRKRSDMSIAISARHGFCNSFFTKSFSVFFFPFCLPHYDARIRVSIMTGFAQAKAQLRSVVAWLSYCTKIFCASNKKGFVGGGPQVSEVTLLGRVTRLSIQSLNGHPHLSCKLDQIKMTDYMDRRVTHLHVSRSLNCVLEVVQ
ncbi:unnamed protein product [Porites lobata]|uniref:EGF-like domain-containing protein n=1 Tax=Porites lobata TaxID=104759 RepID=A0ABN8S9R0_9CNID|nr:unnamed protein product [Porites lobata]